VSCVLVVGGLPAAFPRPARGRANVADGIAELAPYAADHGVKLAIEPLHRCSARTARWSSTLARRSTSPSKFPG